MEDIKLPHKEGASYIVAKVFTDWHGFASRPGHTKDHHKNGTNCLLPWHAMYYARSLTVQPDCLKGRVVCGTVWGHALKRYPGINRKSRVLYPGPGFLMCYMAFAAEKALGLIKVYRLD